MVSALSQRTRIAASTGGVCREVWTAPRGKFTRRSAVPGTVWPPGREPLPPAAYSGRGVVPMRLRPQSIKELAFELALTDTLAGKDAQAWPCLFIPDLVYFLA